MKFPNKFAPRCLIIEDEPLIALDIQTLVEQLGHDVTTIARTHTEAVRAALKAPSRALFWPTFNLPTEVRGSTRLTKFWELRKSQLFS